MRFETGPGQFLDVPVEYITTTSGMARCVEWVKTQDRRAVDLETSGLDARRDRIATMQIGNLERAFVIDVRCVMPFALKPLLDLLNDTKGVWFGQNLRFEYRFLRQNYGVRLRSVVDTQLAECVVRTGLLGWASTKGNGKKRRWKSRDLELESQGESVSPSAYGLTSMGHQARHYLGIEIEKDKDLRMSFDKTSPGRHSERQVHYAAGDVIYPFLIFEKQLALLKARKLTSIFRMECDALSVIGEMEHQGMLIDTDQWLTLYQKAVADRRVAQRKLDQIFLGFNNDLFNGTWEGSRPLCYLKRKGKGAQELNYDSPEHVQWAIKTYCQNIRWKVEIVTTQARRNELMQSYGAEWLSYRNQIARERGQQQRPIEDAPDYLLPEEKFCVLISVEKNVLKLAAARNQLPRDLVLLLLEYSRASQLCTAFGAEWLRKIRSDTGRMHPEWHQCMTTTGRLSSQPNLQQIPKGAAYRKCFIPRKGYKFVVADYSQQEPRLLAYASQDPGYVQTYLDHDDLYIRVGANMLGERPEKGSLIRDIMKAIVLAKAYRSGIAKQRDQLTLAMFDRIMAGEVEPPTMAYSKELDELFYQAFPTLKKFQDQCSDQADPRKGPKIYDDLVNAEITYIRDPSGRCRFFPPGTLTTYTEAPNMICQGASATMTKVAAALFQTELFVRGWQERCFIVNLVHDEILAEAEDAIAQECAYLLQQCMIRAAEKFCPGIPFEAEFPENSTGVLPFWAKKLPAPVAKAA